MANEESAEREAARYPLQFDKAGRLVIKDKMLGDKLKSVLMSGELEIVIAPEPMMAGVCPIPPKPRPPVIACGADRYHLEVKS